MILLMLLMEMPMLIMSGGYNLGYMFIIRTASLFWNMKFIVYAL